MVEFAEALRERMVRKGREVAVDWKESVADFIVACLNADGVPMFRTRFGGQRFDGLVLGVCWGVKGAVPSRWFTNIPEEDVDHLEAETGDWKWVLHKYGTDEQKRKGLSPEALRAFAEKRIPALAGARSPELTTLVLRTERMGAVDKLGWQSKVRPDMVKVGARVEGGPEFITIRLTPGAASRLSDGTWSILVEWGEQGIVDDSVSARVEDINTALEGLLPGSPLGRAATGVREIMRFMVDGREGNSFLLEGMVVSARIEKGRAELGVDDGSGTLLLIVRPEHVPSEVEGMVRRDDVEALEDALVQETVTVPVKATSLFLRAITDGPIQVSPPMAGI